MKDDIDFQIELEKLKSKYESKKTDIEQVTWFVYGLIFTLLISFNKEFRDLLSSPFNSVYKTFGLFFGLIINLTISFIVLFSIMKFISKLTEYFSQGKEDINKKYCDDLDKLRKKHAKTPRT